MQVNKLKAKIIENGLTVEKTAEIIGVNPSTLYRKLKNGASSFSVEEAGAIVSALKLTVDEVNAIFFNYRIA